MSKMMNLLLIGGAWKNAGKTTFSEKIIKKIKRIFPKITLIAVKVTILRDMENQNGYAITEEKGEHDGKDTARLLRAGSNKVFWLRCDEKNVIAGWNDLMKNIPDGSFILCESNTLRKFINPYLYIMVCSKDKNEMKSSAQNVKEFVDFFVQSENRNGEVCYDPDLSLKLTIDENESTWKLVNEEGIAE